MLLTASRWGKQCLTKTMILLKGKELGYKLQSSENMLFFVLELTSMLYL